MPTALEERIESSASVPACLPWVENPYRPVSLWDIVIQFSTDRWFWAGYEIESIITDCLMKPGPGLLPFDPAVMHQPVTDATKSKAIKCVEILRDECIRLGFSVSSETAIELLDWLNSGKRTEWQWLRNQLHGLQRLVRKEIGGKSFFYVPPDKMRFWPTADIPYAFTEPVAIAFPSTVMDSNEAGVCLALGRSTACVFHLMRVLEIALGVIGQVFNVSLAHTNWAPAIEEIEKKIRDMHKDPAWKALPDCKEQQEFYSQALSHFGIAKDAWRNYTNHARGVYTEELAALIFDNVGAFMKKLATRLHE